MNRKPQRRPVTLNQSVNWLLTHQTCGKGILRPLMPPLAMVRYPNSRRLKEAEHEAMMNESEAVPFRVYTIGNKLLGEGQIRERIACGDKIGETLEPVRVLSQQVPHFYQADYIMFQIDGAWVNPEDVV